MLMMIVRSLGQELISQVFRWAKEMRELNHLSKDRQVKIWWRCLEHNSFECLSKDFFHFIIGLRTKIQAENSQTRFGNSNSKNYAN